MANFCSNCGSPIADDAKFCPNCGASLSVSEQIKESQPSQVTEKSQSANEDKVYFDGMINSTHCKICSTNWYLGENKIMPVTSIAAVSYEKTHLVLVGWILVIIGIIAFFFMVANNYFVEFLIMIVIVCGPVGLFLILKGFEGRIVVQSNSAVYHYIECSEDEYSKCLNAMNECLKENR